MNSETSSHGKLYVISISDKHPLQINYSNTIYIFFSINCSCYWGSKWHGFIQFYPLDVTFCNNTSKFFALCAFIELLFLFTYVILQLTSLADSVIGIFVAQITPLISFCNNASMSFDIFNLIKISRVGTPNDITVYSLFFLSKRTFVLSLQCSNITKVVQECG